MTVYVGPLRRTPETRWKAMCHCFADSLAELFALADKCDWPYHWLHHGPHGKHSERRVPFLPHFDLTESQRRKAIANGAVVLRTLREEGEASRVVLEHFEDLPASLGRELSGGRANDPDRKAAASAPVGEAGA